MVLVLDLRFRKRRLILRTPENRLETLIDPPTLDKFPEFTNDRGFIPRSHRQVGMIPFSQHPQPLEFLSLSLHKPLGIVATESADCHNI